jgi:hypothetical protein
MTLSTSYPPEVDSCGDRLTVTRASNCLCLAAAPTFAVMALLTGLHGGGMPDMLCSVTPDGSPLTGTVPMYLLMSAFHAPPWLKLVSRWCRGHDV